MKMDNVPGGSTSGRLVTPGKTGPMLAWTLTGMFLVVAVLLFVTETIWDSSYPLFWRVSASLLLLGGTATFTYTAVNRILAFINEQRMLMDRMEQAERSSARSYRRLGAILLISQKFVEANDEKEIIDLLLRTSVDITSAKAAAFVPLDEHGQPMAAVYTGQAPFPVPDDWLEYIASPLVRDRCRNCEKDFALDVTCPLLKGPFSEYQGLYCTLLRRNDREYGVLNLYLAKPADLDEDTQSFIHSLIDETSLALEGLRLRNRELAVIQHMQDTRQKNDPSSLLAALLDNVRQTLDADLALLFVHKTGDVSREKPDPAVPLQADGASAESGLPPNETLVSGVLPAQAQPYITVVIERVLQTSQAYFSGEGAALPNLTIPAALRSLLAVPLDVQDDTPSGVLLVGCGRPRGFHPRQLALLQTLAGQAALVLLNERRMANLEYQAMMDERTRLAREIHDGLAQTLGFLKLQLAQMQGYLSRNELDRLRQSMTSTYDTLSEAYQDIRYAIDGLRIYPSETSMASWLRQIIADFSDSVVDEGTLISIEKLDVNIHLPPEVQAQFIRIIQEALSNIRKHAKARNVWITWCENAGEAILEVRDDGQGFEQKDISGPSQHGLRGMRERAELIRGVFQVVSSADKGTTVRVVLPLKIVEGGK